MSTRIFTILILFITSIGSTYAQLDIGLLGGLNLSKGTGYNYRSTNRIGLQFGAFFTYHFNAYLGLQAEPSYNITRLRTMDHGDQNPNSIDKGNKSLDYFNLPLLAKLNITPGVALLGGIEYNKLINDERHRLRNGGLAFKENGLIGYAVGLEFGKIYFRYRGMQQFDRIGNGYDSSQQQFQLGLRWKLL